MGSGRFRRARRRPLSPSPGRRYRNWEGLLDWWENRRSIGRVARLLTVCGLPFGWMLRRSRREVGWRRDRGGRPPVIVAEAPERQGGAARKIAQEPPPAVQEAPAAAPVPTPAAPPTVTAAAPSATTTATTPVAHPSGRRSVLVVDDDKSARKTITTILTKASFDVLEAGTVAEAVRRLADRPDWILLDLMLPDGSGCGVLREVTGQGSPSRVCVISGAGPSMLGEARSLGARHVLSKPLDLPRLMSILAT